MTRVRRRTWNHAVGVLPDELVASDTRRRMEISAAARGKDASWWIRGRGSCTGYRCARRRAFWAAFWSEYRVHYGQERIERHYCRQHAERFAKKHGLELPDAAPPLELRTFS